MHTILSPRKWYLCPIQCWFAWCIETMYNYVGHEQTTWISKHTATHRYYDILPRTWLIVMAAANTLKSHGNQSFTFSSSFPVLLYLSSWRVGIEVAVNRMLGRIGALVLGASVGVVGLEVKVGTAVDGAAVGLTLRYEKLKVYDCW